MRESRYEGMEELNVKLQCENQALFLIIKMSKSILIST
jgi:hypothetical protein